MYTERYWENCFTVTVRRLYFSMPVESDVSAIGLSWVNISTVIEIVTIPHIPVVCRKF